MTTRTDREQVRLSRYDTNSISDACSCITEYLHNAASQAADHESARLMTHAASIWRDLRPSARLHFTFEAYQVLHPATGHHHRPSVSPAVCSWIRSIIDLRTSCAGYIVQPQQNAHLSTQESLV